jgi:hypothetical protein
LGLILSIFVANLVVATENTEDTEREEKDDLMERIIGARIEVHRIRRSGLLKSIHEEAMAVEYISLCPRCPPWLDPKFFGGSLVGLASLDAPCQAGRNAGR